MKRSHLGTLLLAVVLFTVFAVAENAQAQTITPTNTAVSGTAASPTLTYSAVTYICDTGTASGTTRSPASTNVDLALSFSGNCKLAGLLSATVTCSGSVNLVASGGATSGTVNLNTGFTCTITISGVCAVDVEGAQTTGSTVTLNESATTLTATVNVNATRTGSPTCGPASGPAAFSASYNVTPNTITIT